MEDSKFEEKFDDQELVKFCKFVTNNADRQWSTYFIMHKVLKLISILDICRESQGYGSIRHFIREKAEEIFYLENSTEKTLNMVFNKILDIDWDNES